MSVYTERERERERASERASERERQRDRETERQRDRETERQRDRETETEAGVGQLGLLQWLCRILGFRHVPAWWDGDCLHIYVTGSSGQV